MRRPKNKGVVRKHVDKILASFHHLPPCVNIFYGMKVDKKWTTPNFGTGRTINSGSFVRKMVAIVSTLQFGSLYK